MGTYSTLATAVRTRAYILGCAQCWGTYLGACGAVVAAI